MQFETISGVTYALITGRVIYEIQPLGNHTFKVVEPAQKKSRILKLGQLFAELVHGHNVSRETFDTLFGAVSDMSDVYSTHEHGPWVLHIDADTKMQEQDRIMKELDAVSAMLTARRLDNLVGGTVHIVNHLHGKYVAFYKKGIDELWISTQLPENLFKYAILHELGHEHFQKNLSDKAKGKIYATYKNEMKKENSPYFLRKYSKKSPEEMWSELFATAILGGIRDQGVNSWMNEIMWSVKK